MRVTKEFVFFWGAEDFLSQWHPSSFNYEGLTFKTAEHWMMFQKAVLFDVPFDTAADIRNYLEQPKQSLHIANKIIRAETPKKAKALGKQVEKFNKPVWGKIVKPVLYRGNHLKLNQNPELMEQFLDFKGKRFVEASPYDKIYGIGMNALHPHATQPEKWQGQNILGDCFTQLSRDYHA
tara:strand:- start:261 stop:797 length:537 start_codon:yes stop_codon:yes gene_type:complete